jgi:hypothetical protein
MAMTLGQLTTLFLESLKPLIPEKITEPKKVAIEGFKDTYFFTTKNGQIRAVILLAKQPLKYSKRHNRLVEIVEEYEKGGVAVNTASFRQDVDRIVNMLKNLS